MYMRVLNFSVRTTLFFICAYLCMSAVLVYAEETENPEDTTQVAGEQGENHVPYGEVIEDTSPSDTPSSITAPSEEPVTTDVPEESVAPEAVPDTTDTYPPEEGTSTIEKITEVSIPVPLPEDEAQMLKADAYGSFELIEQPIFVLEAQGSLLENSKNDNGEEKESSVTQGIFATVQSVVNSVLDAVSDAIGAVVDATTETATFVINAVMPAGETTEAPEASRVPEVGLETQATSTGTEVAREEVVDASDTEIKNGDALAVGDVPAMPYTVRAFVDGHACTYSSNLLGDTRLAMTIIPSCMTPGTHHAHIEVEVGGVTSVWEGLFVWGGEVIATHTLDATHALVLITSPKGSTALWLRESVSDDTLYTFLEARANATTLPPIGMEGETILWVADAQNALVGYDMLSHTTFSQSLEKRRVDTEIPLHETWYTVHTDAQTVDLVPASQEEAQQ